jgi:hypothetical protein
MTMQVLIRDKRERKNVVMYKPCELLRLAEWKKRHMDLDGEWAATLEEDDFQEIMSRMQ